MPLTTDDLTAILTTAIVQLKFAKEDVAPNLAKTLAAAIVTPLNALGDDAPPWPRRPCSRCRSSRR
jgi:hypothetical protein